MRLSTRMSFPLITLFSGSVQGEFVLVSNSQARAEIVLGESLASDPLAFAGHELQRYVKAMSGATLPVSKATTGRPAITITAERGVPAERAGERFSPASEDRYRLEIGEKGVIIHGASPRAALFGAYDLLERLGCGWCVPGDDTVPTRSTVAIGDLKLDTTPAFSFRALVDYPMLTIAQSTALIDWLAKNRMNWYHPAENARGEPKKWYEWRDKLVPEIRKRGLHLNFGGHTMHTWVPPELFKQHSEWFRYKDAIRKAPTLCVTNPEMTAELIRNMRRFLDRCPEIEVIDLWHPDDDAFCYCPTCTKGTIPAEAQGTIPASVPMDSVREAYIISYIEFLNRVAAAIASSHPKVYVQPLIYGGTDHAMPDGCPAPADNLLLGLAHIRRDTYRPLSGEPKSKINMRFLGNDLTWMARTRNSYIYEYYSSWWWPFIYPGVKTIVRDLQILRTLGANGVSSDLYGYSHCNMYAAARALWSPDISWEATVRDFCTRHFGDVAQQMAENHVNLENSLDGADGTFAGDAHEDPSKWMGCGRIIHAMRPGQIGFLEGLIGRTQDRQVKARLERELVAWKVWGEEARWWGLPKFEDTP